MFANPKTQKRYIKLGNTIRAKKDRDAWFKGLSHSSQRVYGTALSHVTRWENLFARVQPRSDSNPLYELIDEETLAVLSANAPVTWAMEDKTNTIPNFRVFVVNEVVIAVQKSVADKIQASDKKYLFV